MPPVTSTALQGISDLVVVAPIRTGIVDGALDSITYARRLELLLDFLNQARQSSREASQQASPFSDLVGRLGIIHCFRFAIVPSANGDPPRLLLNVTFDGGWESYMRIVWRDLGPLLDMICCHCDGYPIAHLSSFDEYMKWVRGHEVPGGFFYVESGATIGDDRYNAAIERMCRIDGATNLEPRSTRHRLKTSQEILDDAIAVAMQNRPAAVAAGIRAITALHSFSRVYPGFRGHGDAAILLRFAKALLPEFRALLAANVLDMPEFAPIRMASARQLEWFQSPTSPRSIPAERLPDDYGKLLEDTQVGVLAPYPDVSHGCLVLLQLDAARLKDIIAFFERWPVTSGADTPGDGMFRTVAFTFAGLAALGLSTRRLAQFPQEFVVGMEARASVLGDLHCNHPTQWKRPLRNWPLQGGAPVPIELSTVHVVVQLRRKSTDTSALTLLPEFEAEIKQMAAAGMTVLAWQPMRRYAQGAVSQEHFGFADGFSQPTLQDPAKPAQFFSDKVRTGDVLLGYRNNLEDGPFPASADPLLDRGSYLVVRKLRQDVARLEQVLNTQAANQGIAKPDQVKELMMGRSMDGTPLVSPRGPDNDFNFSGDSTGDQCPFQSHVRRANPRPAPLDPKDPAPVPRITRRGMSYGTRRDETNAADDRGVVFMAYNASIAEQFEVIQRWIAGGNSSGVSSEQSDPFLGVPEPGQSRSFRCWIGGAVKRLNLGDQPFVQLQWGMYLFAPPVSALRQLAKTLAFDAPPEVAKATMPSAETPADALKVLRDDGGTFSVSGYGDRLAVSLGNGHLGQDLQDPGRLHATEINDVIASVSEQDAFDVAFKYASQFLAGFLALQRTLPGMDTLPLETFVDQVLGASCREWFGLPDIPGKYMVLAGRSANPDEPARCPGHFYSVGRYIFSPAPSPTEEVLGKAHGKILLAAARAYVRDGMPGAGPLSQKFAGIFKTDQEGTARTIVGVILGFPPTTGGNLLTVLGTWLVTRELWNLQRALRTNPINQGYAHANQVLRQVLLKTMCRSPVPAAVWRTAMAPCELGGAQVNLQSKIVVKLGKAIENGADPETMFGRAPPATPPTTHGCPGRAMAFGVMLGTLCALLNAGQLQAASDPRFVILRPF